MDLARLAAKQKRVKDWSEFLATEAVDPALRSETQTRLNEFKAVLTHCWEANTVSEQDEQRILDLERQLEQLNEEARVRGGRARA